MRVFASLALIAIGMGYMTHTVQAQPEDYYTNPVINRSAPDPTVLRTADGAYYLYATENVPNLPIFKSDDLVNWELIGTAFTDESRPKMVPDGNIWAPDIQYIDGRYVLYYSKSRWGGEWECGIGVAVADAPEGPFIDRGPLFISKDIGVQNSIDPVYFAEGDKKYLFWGSFRGIYAIELADDGLSVKRDAKPIQIAGTFTEGTNIFKHDGYYYLIGSAGSCCEGERSTYRVVMARSGELLGPYVNKEGEAAMDNGFSLLMSRSKDVIGPGHNANFVADDAGQFWMLYHGFDAADPEAGRKVYLDRIIWDSEGWPTVEAHQPSGRAIKPVIKRKGLSGTVEKSITSYNLAEPGSRELLLADPTIVNRNGKYYMAGTQPVDPSAFTVLESDDLITWRLSSAGKPQLTPGKGIFRDNDFWAPQFVDRDSKVYLFYTANEQVARAMSDSITGLYHSVKPIPIDASEKNIDPFLFRDTDGKYYLYHVRFDNGNFLWVGEYDFDNDQIVDGTLQPIFRNDQPWEHTLSYESAPIMEGPAVVKIDDTYYLFYSANHFMSKDYAVGYATAPTPVGPWTKNPDNPIIHHSIVGAPGSGHGDVFRDKTGNLRYVFHIHNSDERVSPRRTRIVSLKLIPNLSSDVPYKIVMEPSSLIKPLL